MSNLKAWFHKGSNKYDYINSMETHQENLLKVYNNVTVNATEKEFLQSLQSRQLKAVILTADWCGDAMVNLPILMRLSDESLLETRYLIRDENLELMDQYLTNGTARSIPIIVFLNNEYEEIGKWGPRAPMVQEMVETLKSDLPDKSDPNYEESFKAFIREIGNRFATDTNLWEEVKRDLIQTLKNL